MSDTLLETKFHRMADPMLGRERAGMVLQWVWTFGKRGDRR